MQNDGAPGQSRTYVRLCRNLVLLAEHFVALFRSPNPLIPLSSGVSVAVANCSNLFLESTSHHSCLPLFHLINLLYYGNSEKSIYRIYKLRLWFLCKVPNCPGDRTDVRSIVPLPIPPIFFPAIVLFAFVCPCSCIYIYPNSIHVIFCFFLFFRHFVFLSF